MSLILGLDTSTRWTSLGCVVDGENIGEINLRIGTHQSARLPELVQEFLQDLGKNITDIDLLAVGTGPGYFTGVRIGLAYSAALAEALGVDVVPACSLQAMIMDLPPCDSLYLPVLWARKKHVYFAAYQRHPEGFTTVKQPCFSSIEKLLTFLSGQDSKVIWVGESTERCGVTHQAIITSWNRSGPRGSNIALLGYLHSDDAIPPSEVRADYQRKPDIGAV